MWKDQRRFLHERFRHFGIKHLGAGREMMEARIMVSAGSSFFVCYFLFGQRVGRSI